MIYAAARSATAHSDFPAEGRGAVCVGSLAGAFPALALARRSVAWPPFPGELRSVSLALPHYRPWRAVGAGNTGLLSAAALLLPAAHGLDSPEELRTGRAR